MHEGEPVFGRFVSPASFRMPAAIVQSAWLEHAPFAMWLVEASRPDLLVELGNHAGFSYLAFCQAVRASALPTRCRAVDTWRGDEHAGFYGEEVFAKLSARHDALYSPFSSLMRSTFDDAAATFADRSIDLLHIDGRHTYADVRHDYMTWERKLSDRAIVLFHDTQVFEGDFGVHRFWKELADERPSFEFTHGNGLGVLRYGKSVGDAEALFAAGGNQRIRDDVRLAYASLGRAITDRWNLMSAAAALRSRETTPGTKQSPPASDAPRNTDIASLITNFTRNRSE